MPLQMNLSCCLKLAIFLFVGAAHAWTFVWHDPDGGAHIKNEDGVHSCAEIALPKGNQYSWDPEGSNYCINLYSDKKCKEQNGLSCPRWHLHPLGQDWVRSWRVHLNETAASSTLSTSTTSQTESTTSAPPTETTPTSTPGPATETPEPSSSDDTSLSGGAIAGIVIGTLAGVGVMVAFGFLAARRRRREKPATPAQPTDKSPPPPPTEEAPPYQPPELDSQAASPIVTPPPAPAPAYQAFRPEKGDAGDGYGSNRPRMAELPDQVPVAELPDQSPVTEMEATEPTAKKR